MTAEIPVGKSVKIVGKHPWTGFTGKIVIGLRRPSVGFLDPMYTVRLDEGQDCPYEHECMAGPRNLKLTK